MGKIKSRINMNKLNQVSGRAMMSAPEALLEKKKQDEKNSYDIINIPVDKLQPMSYNREVYDVDDLDFLGATISQYGLAQPLVVQKQPNSDMYNIVAGERRFQSYLKSKEAGTAKGLYPNGLPCHVYPEDMSIVDIKIMLLITNATARARTADMQRKELQELVTLFQEAENSGTPIGFSLKELAQNHLKIAERQYQRYMSALRVIPELKPLTDSSDVILAAAIGSMPEDVQKELYQYMQEHDCSIEDAYKAINEEYSMYRQQIRDLRTLVKELQQKKKQASEKLKENTTPAEQSIREEQFRQSDEALNVAKESLKQFQENAGNFIRNGLEDKKKEEKKKKEETVKPADSQKKSGEEESANNNTLQKTESASLLSVNAALKQITQGLNAIGLQMKLCDGNDLEQLKEIRDRINGILSVSSQNNMSLF